MNARLAGVVGAALLAFTGGTAHAATIEVVDPGPNGDRALIYTGAPGDQDFTQITHAAGVWVAEDAGLTPGNGCTDDGFRRVECPDSPAIDRLIVHAGDRDDHIEVDTETQYEIDGEEGNDWIDVIGTGFPIINGGPDRDTISARFARTPWWINLDGFAGPRIAAINSPIEQVEDIVGSPYADFLRGDDGPNKIDGGQGDDDIAGRGGRDLVDYSIRWQPLQVTLDRSQTSGGPGEADLISPDVENVRGGSGDDALTGNDGDNNFWGGLGDDTLHGRGGADLYEGYAGFDTAYWDDAAAGVSADADGVVGDDGTPGEGDTVNTDVEGLVGSVHGDTLTGGSGRNLLSGGQGPDTLVGGDGDDDLDGGQGSDLISAGAGDDILRAVDEEMDALRCGTGDDRALADPLDTFSECESVVLNRAVAQPPSAGGDTTAPRAALGLSRRSLSALSRKGLPLRVRGSEAGAVEARLLTTRGGVLGRGSARLAAPGTRTVVAKLSGVGRKLVRRKRRLKVRVQVTLTDAAGNRSTAVTKTITLKR